MTVLTRSFDPQFLEDTSHAPNVQVLSVPTFWQPLRVLQFSRATANAATASRFDIVHSFSRTRHQDLYRAGGGSHREYLRRSSSGGRRIARQFSPRHRVLLALEAAIFRDPTQRIQCASRFVADTLTSQHFVSSERIFLLPNAVDTARYGTAHAHQAGRRLRTQLDEKAERVWLFPASGWRRKGLGRLLEAVAKMKDPGFRLWIAGRDDPTPWQKMIADLGISDLVRFLGPRDDLEVVYGAVDAMVLPTHYDAFANVTLEAAASGLPVLTTRANGASEWLSNAVVCLDLGDAPNTEGDSDRLANAMQDLADRERAWGLGEQARRIVQRMDWPSHAAALSEEYRRILELRRQKQ
ncbi:MAG TPA: glycosyltransferase [Myxococcales bacterium]|nr:glycosyltransferase [Myxococcales bacterium]HIK85277.1 glycosyltransferase [Myxococcales bacterium]